MEGAEMSESNPFHMLVGRALVDEKFRKRLLSQTPSTRKKALKEVGIDNPTQGQLQVLQNAIDAFLSLHGSFGEGVGAA
jgi:hypothetical protein